jgi:hypothetical protein
MIFKQQAPQLMKDVAQWANSKTKLKSGKPLFKNLS